MPELPEVETVCRVMRRALVGQRIERVDAARDPLVLSGLSPHTIEDALKGRVVEAIGRHGKFFWIALRGPGPTVYAHLGMSGWVREVGAGTRLAGHGDAPFDDATRRPRFLRLHLETSRGRGIVLTDARRLSRVWLGDVPERERRVKRLGPDAFDELPKREALLALFARRKRAIKAVLLDQTALAGIGNWIADEVLYQAAIAPTRLASSLSQREVSALRGAIVRVIAHAVRVAADHRRFPKTWLFEHRWGGGRGSKSIGGHRIVRTIVGGRTTAWVPDRQK